MMRRNLPQASDGAMDDTVEPADPTRGTPADHAAGDVDDAERPPARAASRRHRGVARAPTGFVPVAVLAVAFLTIPLASLVVRAPWGELGTALSAPGVLPALRLSLVCSLGATALSVAVRHAAAWVLAARPVPGPAPSSGPSCMLPMVLPPGRRRRRPARSPSAAAAWSAEWLDDWFGIQLPFTTAGAILAETFVAMPFFVITVEAGLRSMDRRYEDVAATLGAGRLDDVPAGHPAAHRPGRCRRRGAAWARALGEFGATITFAGNIAGRTQTLPLAVYLAAGDQPRRGHRAEPGAAGGVPHRPRGPADRWFRERWPARPR